MTTIHAGGPKPSPSSTSTPATNGESLRRSPAVRASIASLVAETAAASARLTDVRPPLPGKKEEYESLLARASAVRGRSLLYPYVGSGLGNGALVELADGSVKWDMICGIGVHFFGHSHPALIEESLIGSLDDTVKHGNLQTNADAIEFAETLLAQARRSSKLKYSYLSTSGAMANENALKVCFQKRAGAPRVIAFDDCFMGRSVTMSQVGDTADYRVGVPLSTLVDYMPFYSEPQAREIGVKKYIDRAVWRLNQYLARYPGQHACFIFELVQGEGGFNPGTRDFFKALMDVCMAKGVAVWDDEIQTFGRLPRMFAYEHFDLAEYVDVFCVGKMTQVCATLFTEEYNPKPGLLSGTFTGEGPSFRVGRRVIEMLRDGAFYDDPAANKPGLISRHHAEFRTHANALVARHPQWFPPVVDSLGYQHEHVGGLGGMMKLTPFAGAKDRINAACKACFDEGVITFACGHGPYHVRMLPPLGVMRPEDWPRVFAVLERGFAKAAQ